MLGKIKIDNKEVPMICNGGALFEYRRFFARDFLGDYLKLESTLRNEKYEDFDSMLLAQVMWICAYMANKDIKPCDEWISEFESPFSLFAATVDFFGFLQSSMKSKVKPKKQKTKEKK